MLQAAAGLLKPCYLFAPSNLFRRVLLRFRWPETPEAEVELPWGMRISVNLSDAIGSEIFRQRIFDLAVSECAWRLLGEGDRVIDAGANIGYMSLLFATRARSRGRVDAFEPHPEVAAALTRNVARNARANVAPVIVHQTALGAQRGRAALCESDYFAINRGTATLASTQGESARAHEVEVERLDDLFPNESFALLKIDVEGFEREVVKGAAQLLASGRVRHVIYEDHTLGERGLAEEFQTQGYTVFTIGHETFGPALLPVSAARSAIDASWESASFLATRDPAGARAAMQPKGWRVLRGN